MTDRRGGIVAVPNGQRAADSETGGATLGAWARTFSLTLSSLLALIVAVFPALLSRQTGIPTLAVLPVLLLGIAGGFVHGVGIRPRGLAGSIIFGPWAAWPLMLASLAFLTLLIR